jgi:hypothetical protein
MMERAHLVGDEDGTPKTPEWQKETAFPPGYARACAEWG